jgi:hypothetical protein
MIRMGGVEEMGDSLPKAVNIDWKVGGREYGMERLREDAMISAPAEEQLLTAPADIEASPHGRSFSNMSVE